MLQEFIMTRLDLFIARMVSQRACLNFAIEETAAMSGPVLELGLGNGRTYHHLRELVKGRDIFVFERKVESHPKSTPPLARLTSTPRGRSSRNSPRRSTRSRPTSSTSASSTTAPRA